MPVAAFLGFEDHPCAGAVFYRLSWIHEFGLAEDGAAGRLRCVLQFDERRVADCFDDVFIDGHAWKCRLSA
jgi:hypothetical protein